MSEGKRGLRRVGIILLLEMGCEFAIKGNAAAFDTEP
jgi:hypothetical protein